MTGLDYSGYLGLPELLALQTPLTPAEQSRVHLSEHFFIVVHQACEVWLRQIILDLRAAVRFLESDEITDAVSHLQRVTTSVLLLAEQTGVLECLTESDFFTFRPRLGTASGAQSAQFHELYRLTGLTAPPGPVMVAVRRIAAAHDSSPQRLRIDLDPAHALYRLADTMDDLAVAVWRWQVVHVKVATRLVGTRPGTGGTSGTGYLRAHTRLAFPDLRVAAT